MVSHEDLDAALEDTLDNEPVEGDAEGANDEGVVEGGDDAAMEEHKERSKLGRKVAAMEEKMDSFFTKFDQFLSKQDQGPAPQAPKKPNYDPSDVVTWQELEDRRKWEEDQKVYEQAKYESDYMDTISQLATGQDPELHDEIFKEMYENFNIKRSDNAKSDAASNYAAAALSIMRKNAGPKNPLKGKDPVNALGVGGPSKATPKEPQLPELDDVTKEYIARQGISEEEVRRAFLKNA